MALFSKIFSKLRSGNATSADWDELERSLIEADIGAPFAAEIIAAAKKLPKDEIEAQLLEVLRSKLSSSPRELLCASGRINTIIVVGVNGTGKTTSVAKLMERLTSQRKRVVVGAADTFRAAAIEQIQTWGSRLGVEVIAGKAQGDPASVAFDSAKRAVEVNADFLIVDTAGRLHTKSGLMDELGKIRRVIEKLTPVDEVLLVVDATTGQNGITQAKLFAESVAVTGLILTKMDGSAKGGVALAIEAMTGIPVKFVGTGESAKDLRPFDSEAYLQGLLA